MCSIIGLCIVIVLAHLAACCITYFDDPSDEETIHDLQPEAVKDTLTLPPTPEAPSGTKPSSSLTPAADPPSAIDENSTTGRNPVQEDTQPAADHTLDNAHDNNKKPATEQKRVRFADDDKPEPSSGPEPKPVHVDIPQTLTPSKKPRHRKKKRVAWRKGGMVRLE